MTDLTVRYGQTEAVRQLSLSVPRGAIRGLIGPNGAGKTTSFNAIGGYVPSAAGQVHVHGHKITRLTPYRTWRAGIGRTFQRVELFWTLTVREHMELAQRKASKRGRDVPSPVQLLNMLGLLDIDSALVTALPLGTCRIVEIARSIATGANVILLDEPCSGLDRHETEQLKSSLQRIHSELGLSLLIVEHDIEFILSIADRISVLNNGRLIAEGTPEEVRASTEVRTAYLGVGNPDAPRTPSVASPLPVVP